MKKFIFAFIVCLLPNLAQAERLNIDITSGNFEPIPIAIHGFTATDNNGADANRTLTSVISNNLKNTGLFKLISPSSFLEKLAPGQVMPTFENWSQIGTQALVTGQVKALGGGKLSIDFRLWDVLTGTQIAGTSYQTSERGLRRVGHQISDEIYQRLTGEKGYFDSRIVYVSETGSKVRKVKRLAIMDQDGYNHQYITGGKSLVLTPRFTPNDQRIIYMSYANSIPRVRTLDIETGRETVIGNFPGMTFAPHYSPDGKSLLISVANKGNTDIYEVSGGTNRLTSDASIDTSASYSPDGSQIVFSSDRGGSQQLYTMSRNGSNVKRITFGGGQYSAPVWSPRGDFVAFTRQSGGAFHIGVIRPDGSGERMLTSSYMDESPSWAPNGRVIVFTREDRRNNSSLYAIDLTGYNERRIATPGNASDPTWSPLLK